MPALLRHGVVLCSLVCSNVLACAAPRGEVSPEATLSEFASALERRDLKHAYGLLSEGVRARLSFTEFQSQIAQNQSESKALAKALGHDLSAHTYARVQLSDTREVTLERRGGRWEIATSLAEFYSQATPREALGSFLRAVERARWDVVLALMPEADAAGLDAETLGKNLATQQEELTRMVALLKTALEAPIEVVGDRATMPYGESFTMRFVRENERWKIEDPE